MRIIWATLGMFFFLILFYLTIYFGCFFFFSFSLNSIKSWFIANNEWHFPFSVTMHYFFFFFVKIILCSYATKYAWFISVQIALKLHKFICEVWNSIVLHTKKKNVVGTNYLLRFFFFKYKLFKKCWIKWKIAFSVKLNLLVLIL